MTDRALFHGLLIDRVDRFERVLAVLAAVGIGGHINLIFGFIRLIFKLFGHIFVVSPR